MRRKASADENGLDIREALFVAHYVANGGNGTNAARAAGYRGDVKSRASDLIKRPTIAAIIKRTRAKKLSELDVRADRVLRELVRIALVDPRKIFRRDGSLIPLAQLDEDTAAAISGVELRSGGTIKLKFSPKTAALELLGKYLEMWNGAGKPATDRFDDLIDALRNPVADTPQGSPPPKKLERIM